MTFSFLILAALAIFIAPGAARGQQRTQAEIDAYQAMTRLEDPAARLAAVEDFLNRWPESGYRTGVLQVGLLSAGELDPVAPLVLEYAERYVESYSQRSPVQLACAFAARQLERMDSHPEAVDGYVARALDGVEALDSRSATGLWDALAFVSHSRGEYPEAVERQRRAVEANSSVSYRITLARYLLDADRLSETEELIADAILEAPDNAAGLEVFNALAARRTSGSAGAVAYKERLVAGRADARLAEADDELAVKQALALAFAKLGFLLDRAAVYAAEVDHAIGPDTGADAYLAARTAVAWVHLARREYETVLTVTAPVLPLASPYAYDFHLARGAAFEALDRDDEAIDAYLESAGMVANPAVMAPLEAVWSRVHGSTDGLETRRESLLRELENWHPAGAFSPPADWSGRVVLAELFTGSECPPCVGADAAFDGLIARYPTTAVAVLVHHEHIPRPDPMTNPDTVARMDYYGRGVIRGVPTAIINGTDAVVGGGGRAAGKGRYGTYSWMIERHLAAAPRLDIDLTGRIRAGALEVTAKVKLTDPALRTRDDLRLRLAVAEELLHFAGSNGVTEHPMVVRSYLGGPDGFALTPGKRTLRVKNGCDLAVREAELLAYLEQYQAENAGRFAGGGFAELKHEIDETRLLVIAFVQNDTTKEVYQARILDLR